MIKLKEGVWVDPASVSSVIGYETKHGISGYVHVHLKNDPLPVCHLGDLGDSKTYVEAAEKLARMIDGVLLQERLSGNGRGG